MTYQERHEKNLKRLRQMGILAQRKVLVVDDDPNIRMMLSRILSANYEVVIARDGREGLALATEKRPDLLLLDVTLPGPNGFALAEKIRHLPGLGAVPIVFITGRDRPADRIHGLQLGARHYVEKPFNLNDIRGKIEQLLPPS